MSDVAEKQVTLADKHVWIIDDEIIRTLAQSELAEFRDDDTLEGRRPIDRGTLIALLRDVEYGDWGDQHVRALCEQLVNTAGSVLAFGQPDAAVRYLERATSIPDAVVYDLVYDYGPRGLDVLRGLEEILRRCLSVVQVYAQEPDAMRDELQRLQDRFPTRMQSAVRKADLDVEDFARVLAKKMECSLSTQLAPSIRRLSSGAIEGALVKIDDLPVNLAVRLLTSGTEIPEDVELVELLSVKMGDAIKSATELTGAVRQYVLSRQVPPDRVSRFVEEIIDILAANVRERIQYEGWLYEVIEAAWEATDQDQHAGDDDRIKETVMQFFSFRVYDRPGDDLVRTGDIILLSSREDAPQDGLPDLHLVLTPPCDLARFWSNTRGVLTLAKMHPMKRGVQRWQEYKNKAPSRISSITACKPAMVLPAVPFQIEKGEGKETTMEDYVLFVYEVGSQEFDGSVLWKKEEGISKEQKFSRSLTYREFKELGLNIERICRVSEPFLSGVLAELRNHLFRSGVPDFPQTERDRLKALFHQ